MIPVVQVGPVAFPLPGLILLAGVWIGMWLAEKYANLYEIKPVELYNVMFIGLVAWVIGGRLGYVVRYWEIFIKDLAAIFSRNLGLFEPIAGVICAAIALLIYAQRKGLPLWHLLGALTPFFAVMMVSLACSNLSSGKAFGSPSNLPWAIQLWGVHRHPTQVYQILLSSAILGLTWPRKGILWHPQPAITFLRFLALTAASLVLVEAFRGDSVLLNFGLRQNQILSWLILVSSLAGLWYFQARQAQT
jgi:phosphatidylglycerol:prolipoprotein diacylglycerol transferase